MSETTPPTTTTDSGIHAESDELSLTAGRGGPTALHDHYLVQKIQHFNRERVPERVVHAKGGGRTASSRSPRTPRGSRGQASSARTLAARASRGDEAHRISRESGLMMPSQGRPSRHCRRSKHSDGK
jgi:hypothetical protein